MDPELLIVLFLILAPLIERLLRGGQKKPPEQPKREIPRREPPRQMPVPRSRTDDEGASLQQPTARYEEESAATILPDDLWEILTGERRPPQRTPVPEPDDEESYDESYNEIEPFDEWADEEPAVAPEPAPRPRDVIRPREEIVRARVEARPREELRPREGLLAAPVHEVPQVVSLEPLVIDDKERHKRFHERVSALTAAAPQPTAPRAFRFASDEDLRRAIIVTEILGPPKGLE